MYSEKTIIIIYSYFSDINLAFLDNNYHILLL
jgi:hypothetical protein